MTAEDSPLRMTIHSMPSPGLDEHARRTASGRLKMGLVLLICALPVIASYFSFYVIKPQSRANYSELIQPLRPMPEDLALSELSGAAVKASSLRGQWLLVVVSAGHCDEACERLLWLQRQLREAVGRDKERIDKVWLIHDTAMPAQRTLAAVNAGAVARLLRIAPDSLARWLQPAAGHKIEQHLYIVDPMGNWMMRAPADPEPARLKRDLERVLQASSSWDAPGR